MGQRTRERITRLRRADRITVAPDAAQASKIRAEFEMYRYVQEPAIAEALVRKTEQRIAAVNHPDPYICTTPRTRLAKTTHGAPPPAAALTRPGPIRPTATVPTAPNGSKYARSPPVQPEGKIVKDFGKEAPFSWY